MSFWSALWGAPDLVNKGVDAAIKAGDALVYTEEEKARYRKDVADWYLKYMEVTRGSDLARRLIALMTMAVFLGAVMMLGALEIAAAFLFDAADNPAQVAADGIMDLITETLVTPVSLIMAFYFTVRLVTNLAQGRK